MTEYAEHYWFARHSTSIIFLIIVLAIIGIYEAFQIPVAVFPTTNFPLIKIGVELRLHAACGCPRWTEQ